MSDMIVSSRAMRPATTEQRCFYCHQAIGDTHRPDCVLLKKKVLIRMIVEYEISVPNHWDKGDVEFNRNDGTLCADNAIEELRDVARTDGCLCERTRFEYVRDTSGEFLEEE